MTSWDEASEAAIAKAYDGVTSTEQWYGALDAFRLGVDATYFHWIGADRHTGAVAESVASDEAPAGKADEYNEHHAATDVRLHAGVKLAPGQFMLDHEHFDARTRARHPIYADWLASVGLHHTMVMMLRRSDDSHHVYAALRSHDAPAFDAKARQFAHQVAPHLSRAQALRHRLVDLEVAASAGMAALDALAHGVWVVDARGRVRQANAAAATRMRSGGSVGVHHARLCLTDPAAQDAWLHHLAAATRGRHGFAGNFSVKSASGNLQFTVLPLHVNHPLTHIASQPLALLVLTPPAEAGLPSADVLVTLLSLTPVEAKLALHLAGGRTVNEFAAEGGSSPHTARTHMRNLLRKTKTHRQADVVRLVQSLRVGG